MDNETEKRIEKLEEFMDSLQQVNTIPYNVDRSFIARGFLKSLNFIYTGRVTLGVLGVSRIPIPGATAKSIAFATYAAFPDTGVVDSYIEAITGGYELHLDGNATKDVNFVVFLNQNSVFNDLT